MLTNVVYGDKIRQNKDKGGFMMLTLKEVAQRLNVHENTVKNFIRGGKLTGYKLNRVWRIKEKDLEKFLNQRKWRENEELNRD